MVGASNGPRPPHGTARRRGGFRLGLASLDGLWGRQGQRMQTACVGKVDWGPGLHVECMDVRGCTAPATCADYGRRGGHRWGRCCRDACGRACARASWGEVRVVGVLGRRRARVQHVDLALAGRPGHVWVATHIGRARAGGMACGSRGRDALLPLQCARAGRACCTKRWACCRGVDCTVGGRTRGGRGALGAWGPNRQKPAVRVVIHLTTGIDRVLACAHFPDVTRSRGPCSEARTVGGVGRCIVAPGICARRQMRGRL